MQASVVLDNVLALIGGAAPPLLRLYEPNVFLEGSIKLTLGKTHHVSYAMDSDGSDILIPARSGRLDLDVERAWRHFGAGASFKMANMA